MSLWTLIFSLIDEAEGFHLFAFDDMHIVS